MVRRRRCRPFFSYRKIKMKRLVYSPSIKAWVKADSGVVDLSPYIVSCRIQRVVDDVSSAEIEFRNPKILQDGKPKFLFTEQKTEGKYLPVFHPMDPITIVMERIQGKPIQVFTGYCDTVPDVQLFPGTAKIRASCTLKRLNYTFWDPALPFVTKFMQNYGWYLDPNSGMASRPDAEDDTGKPVNKLNDSSIANMLYAVLNEIGGWDDKNIYIQPLPPGISKRVIKLFDEFIADNESASKEVGNLIKDFIKEGPVGSALNLSLGNGATGDGSDPNSPTSLPQATEKQRVNIIRDIGNNRGVPPEFILAVALVETELKGDDSVNNGIPFYGYFQWQSSGSYVQRPPIDMSKAHDLAYAADRFALAAKAREQFKNYGASSAGWARSIQLNPSSVNGVLSPNLGPNAANPSGNARFSDAQFPGFVNRAKVLLDKHK